MSHIHPGILIAGHGQMGKAFETLLGGRRAFQIWDVAPGRTAPTATIQAAARNAGVVFACVPTQALAAVLSPLAAYLPRDAAAIAIAKGLDDGGATAADILHAAWENGSWGVFGGPMVASDICAGRAAYAEFASQDPMLPGRMHALFADSALRFRAYHAPRAVSWCGVLKNIYALLVGLADGLNLGANVRGHLVMAALAEMGSFLAARGEDPACALGEAGLADFVATVSSPDSHHYNLGRALARGEGGAAQCEGMHSLRVLGRNLDARHHALLGVASALPAGVEKARHALHAWLERDEPAA